MALGMLKPFRSGGAAERGGGYDPFQMLYREMNRLFDDVSRSWGGQTGNGTFLLPQMDVCERDKEVCITAELPGVLEKDIEVALIDDVLTIRGEKKAERKEERENAYFAERSYGTFQRSLQLPYKVEPNEVKANFENGVLTVTIPKKEPAQGRKIPVHGQSGGGAKNAA